MASFPAWSNRLGTRSGPDEGWAACRIAARIRVVIGLHRSANWSIDSWLAAQRAQSTPRTEYYLAVTAPNDELVGFARLGVTGVKAAKLGYAIRADRWGKGYATDAARSMITFGFEDLRLHRISAAIGPDNEASIAVVQKLGMKYEGRIRDHVFTNGAWRDSVLYAVLDHEWTYLTSRSK